MDDNLIFSTATLVQIFELKYLPDTTFNCFKIAGEHPLGSPHDNTSYSSVLYGRNTMGNKQRLPNAMKILKKTLVRVFVMPISGLDNIFCFCIFL